MRVAFLTLGTRGDVQPYVALGQELVRRGHSAVVCTGESFRDFVHEHGVEYARAEADLAALLRTPEGTAAMGGGLKNLPQTLKYARDIYAPAFRKSLDDFWAAAQGADLIVYHPKALGAVDMANALGVPAVSMPPVPITWPVDEFPNLALSATRDFGPTLNRLTYKPLALAESASLGAINDFRQKTLGLGTRKGGIYTWENAGKPIPIIVPVSPALFRDVTSWNGFVHLPGFFFLDTGAQQLEPAVEAFLAAGPPPVVVTFGSMPLREPALFAQRLVQALALANGRALVLTGGTNLQLPAAEHVLAVEGAPHALLFPRARGILHHGGVGTMAEALRSGRPQAIMPFAVDQPFWAHRLHRLGYALAPLDERRLTAEQLATVLAAMADPRAEESAAQIAAVVRSEPGVTAGAQLLEGFVQPA